jgi:hypothetical protein
MRRVTSLLRTTAGLIALGALLVSCGPAARQSPPKNQPQPAASDEQQRQRQEQELQLQTLTDEAEDLFNRGENDLACERVRQAQELQSTLDVEFIDPLGEQAKACIEL